MQLRCCTQSLSVYECLWVSMSLWLSVFVHGHFLSMSVCECLWVSMCLWVYDFLSLYTVIFCLWVSMSLWVSMTFCLCTQSLSVYECLWVSMSLWVYDFLSLYTVTFCQWETTTLSCILAAAPPDLSLHLLLKQWTACKQTAPPDSKLRHGIDGLLASGIRHSHRHFSRYVYYSAAIVLR